MGDPPPPPPAKPKGLVDLLQEGAGTVMGGLGDGLEKAGAALATPENAEIAALLPATNLPELSADGAHGALGLLATRLDREADLFRAVALRELARSGWVERIAQTVVVIAAACMAAVAAIAVTLAFFGSAVEGRGSLLVLAAAIVGAAGIGAAASASRMRATHAKLAEEALDRARAVEDRLFRVAIAMEWKTAGATLYQDALARLERDVATPREGLPRAEG
ncbi:MAG: hypothetical protein JST00_22305 [Deltaproteobacteria bacterium]|nr:hypothetical protein [Deltaproteobacteria bacterium]